MTTTKQWKRSFTCSEEDFERGERLPRNFNLSEKLRIAYQNILDEAGV